MSTILVYVEHQDNKPKKSSLTGITAAQQLAQKTGAKIVLLLLGPGAAGAAEHVRGLGATKVLTCEDAALEHYLAESYTQALVAAVQASDATYVLGGSSSTTKDLLPRVAGRLQAAMATDIMSVEGADTFKRPMWAGNVVATVKLTTPRKVCSVRTTEFDQPTAGSGASPLEGLSVSVDVNALKARFVSFKAQKSERPDVTTADIVVSGGRGVKGPEGFQLVEQLADLLNAGVGASRAVCDAGWVPNDLQIGQTGKVVAPNLYIAVGISGAIQHLAGMKGSKTIVAINKDPEAPIFSVADYGLVADLFQAVPELMDAIKKIHA